jgi:hypothetical protein
MEFYCVFPLELLSLLYPRTTRQYKASLSLGSGSLCDSRRVVEARRGSVLRVSPSRALLGRRSVVYVALTWFPFTSPHLDFYISHLFWIGSLFY